MPQRDAQKSEVHKATDDATTSPANDGRTVGGKTDPVDVPRDQAKKQSEKTTGNSGPGRNTRQG